MMKTYWGKEFLGNWILYGWQYGRQKQRSNVFTSVHECIVFVNSNFEFLPTLTDNHKSDWIESFWKNLLLLTIKYFYMLCANLCKISNRLTWFITNYRYSAKGKIATARDKSAVLMSPKVFISLCMQQIQKNCKF